MLFTTNEQELEKVWRSVLSDIELQIPKASFATWLKSSRLVDKKDGMALVALPNNFTRTWVENKYNKIILGSIRLIDDSTKNIKFIVQAADPSLPSAARGETLAKLEFEKKQLTFPEMKIDPETNLNPKYTFATFVVGSANELAYAAAQGVIQEIGKKYNPLFIYGGVGLGKTHLIQALGNEIARLNKNKIVKYVSSEKFTSELVAAIQVKEMGKF